MDSKTAKIFKSGNSQAVRIPKEFQLEGTEVEVERRGDTLILRPKRRSWAPFLESLEQFSDDFMKTGREQPDAQDRDEAFS